MSDIKIGSRVRFLSDVGGGKVVGFQKGNIVLVEDEDGFQIPTLMSDVVVIETEDYNTSTMVDVKKKSIVVAITLVVLAIVVGIALYAGFVLFFLLRIVRRLREDFKGSLTAENFTLALVLALQLGLAQFSGALVRRPNVSIYFALILALIWHQTRKEEAACS